MRIGSVFSGIGLLDLAVERVTSGQVEWQCELDPWRRSVLEKHWPTAIHYPLAGDTHVLAGKTSAHEVDLRRVAYSTGHDRDHVAAAQGRGEAGGMIAALFVEATGVYARPEVDLWDIERDARLYAGPWPVVAHPPCERWGRYWSGGPSAKVRRKLGDDGGCFRAALACVRRWGGVLEHPEASHAWRHHGLTTPPKSGGWIRAGDSVGWTCCVEQGHYGHAARKATWLYACCVELPELMWGPCGPRGRLEPGFHSAAERAAAPPERRLVKRLNRAQRVGTPPQFAELLLSIAATAGGPR